jgi:hypothetical protein
MPAKEETIVYEADPDALTVDLVDDPLVKEFRDKLVDEVLTIDAGDIRGTPGESGAGEDADADLSVRPRR